MNVFIPKIILCYGGIDIVTDPGFEVRHDGKYSDSSKMPGPGGRCAAEISVALQIAKQP